MALHIPYMSEKDFLKKYRREYLGKEEARVLYHKLLADLQKSMVDDDVDILIKICTLISYVTKVEKQTTLQDYFKSAYHFLSSSNVIIFACKYNRHAILKYFLDNERVLNNFTINVGKNRILPSDTDETHHNAFYYAIRSSNTAILDTLCNEWPGDYWAGRVNELDEIISAAFEALKLKNVPLSREMEILVEEKLLNLRFFSSSTEQVQSFIVDCKGIKERICFVLEIIELLRDEFLNKKEVDDKFIFVARTIAQNIHILKSQLKVTYDQIPWEEMEFCLVCFLSSYVKVEENILVFCAVLRKDKVLSHLGAFSKKLSEISEFFLNGQNINLSTLPNSSREKVIENIIRGNPEFEGLYSDYQEVRDYYSFEKINSYTKLTLTCDCKEKEGQFAILRTLQIIGEHLKNTLDSPKLSKTAYNFLLLSVPKSIRQICVTLRNSQSHMYSLNKRIEVEELSDDNFFITCQEDIQALGKVLDDVLLMLKVKQIRKIANDILECKSVREVQSITSVVNNIKLEDKDLGSDTMTRQQKLKYLVERLDLSISDKTSYEEELFKTMHLIISSGRSDFVGGTNDYKESVSILRYTMSEMNRGNFGFKEMKKMKQGIIKILQNMTPDMKCESCKEIAKVLIQISTALRGRLEDKRMKDVGEVQALINEIFFLTASRIEHMRSVDELCQKLSEKELLIVPERLRKNYNIEEINYQKLLKQKINDLDSFLSSNSLDMKSDLNYIFYQSDESLRVPIELLLLDITSILDDSQNCLEYNQLFLDEYAPFLVGRNLLNYLAHDNALMGVVLSDTSLSVIMNANKIVSESIIDKKQKIGKLVKDDVKQLREKFNEQLSAVINQQELFAAMKESNLENLVICLRRSGDLFGRNIKLSSLVHCAAEGPNVDVAKFLLRERVTMNVKDCLGRSPLHIAAEHGNRDIVEFFVKEAGLSIESADKFGRTPLHVAVHLGHKKIVEFFLQNVEDPGIKDWQGLTPLQYAVYINHVDIVKIFVNNVATTVMDEALTRLSSLHIAAERGHHHLAQLLLKKYDNVNLQSDKGFTPLHLAALNGWSEVVQTLILGGSEVNIREMSGCTPLFYATEDGHDEVVSILVKNGANVNIPDNVYRNTPLHTATKEGYGKIVEILLKYQTNYNLTSREGNTALHFACEIGHFGIVLSLLNNGANCNALNLERLSPLHLAAANGRKEITEILLNHGAHVDGIAKTKCRALHVAAKNGYLDIVKLLLENGATINAQEDDGYTALHMAATGRYGSVVKFLLERNAELNIKAVNGREPLHCAALKGDVESAVILLENGAAVNATDNDGMMPLHTAALHGHSRVCEILIAHKADINAKSCTGDMPVEMAVKCGHKEVVELLVSNGCVGNTLIKYAVTYSHRDIVEVLLSRGFDVNAEGCAALMYAILRGSKEVVDILLRYKADINERYVGNYSALHLASLAGHRDIVTSLLELGADINSFTSTNETPLQLATCNTNGSIVDSLIAHGADMNLRSSDGRSPLHWASINGDWCIVKVFFDNKVNVNVKDEENRTPLEFAVTHKHLAVVKVLLQFEGIDVNAKGEDDIPLFHHAVEKSNLKIIKCLVNAGADIYIKNALGLQPIHLAARQGSKEIVEFLVSKGCSITDCGVTGETLLHHAVLGGQVEVIEYLLSLGSDVNAKDKNDLTPIHIAAQYGHKSVTVTLLSNGAIYNAVDKLGREPLKLASGEDVVNVLTLTEKLFKAVQETDIQGMKDCIKGCAVVSAKDSECQTPLHYAASNGNDVIVNYLLETAANPNAVDDKGFSPLHYAVKFSHISVVKQLLSNGAVYNPISHNGETPLDLAEDKDIAYLLKLVDDSFQKVENCRRRVVKDLNKVEDMDIIKAVLRACNKKNETLIVTALRNHFPEIMSLKEVYHDESAKVVQEAQSYADEGRYTQALCIYDQLFNDRVELLGSNSPVTLDIQRLIGRTLYKQRVFEQALQVFEDIYHKRKTLLGSDDLDTLDTRCCLALVLHRQGKKEEALKLLKLVYQKQKLILGENNVDTVSTLGHIAVVLESLGRYEVALKISEYVFNFRRQKFGENDFLTLTARNSLAKVLSSMGDYEKASIHLKEIFSKQLILYGTNHPETLRTLNRLGVALYSLRKYKEAQTALLDLFYIQKNNLGSIHPYCLYTQKKLAYMYLYQGKYFSAYKMAKDYVDFGHLVFGPSDEGIKAFSKLTADISKVIHGQGFGDLLENMFCDIHSAAGAGDIRAVKFLLTDETDANATDVEGKTALHFAARNGHVDVVDVLIEKGANVSQASSNGNTSLHMAASRGYFSIIEMILKHINPDKICKFVNSQNTVGVTALHLAAKNGFVNIVKYLLEHGAIYNIVTKDDQTPLGLTKDKDVIRLLNMIDELFCDAQEGKLTVINKLERVNRSEFAAVNHARDVLGNTLLQTVIALKHRNIAIKMLEMFKNNSA